MRSILSCGGEFENCSGLKQTEVNGFKIVMDKTLSFAIGKIPVYGGAIATSYDILNPLYGEYQNVSGNINLSFKDS